MQAVLKSSPFRRRFGRVLASALVATSCATGATRAQAAEPTTAPQSAPAAAEPTTATGPTRRIVHRQFLVDIPAMWREMTPDEARRIRDQLPFDMRDPIPNEQYVIGAIDAWLDGAFDGRALLVTVYDGWTNIDEEALAKIRDHWADYRGPAGETRAVTRSALAKIGREESPALELETDTKLGDGRVLHARDHYVPTGDQIAVFSYRAWDDDFAAAEPTFAAISSTLLFARPGRNPDSLMGRLLYAALIGGLVGLVLLALSKGRRRV